jgi:hypothetical protein
MSRGYRLFVFYAAVALLAIDVYAVLSRFMGAPADSVSWQKILFALLLQAIALAILIACSYYMSIAKLPLVEGSSRLWSPGWRIVPFFAACLLAAYSYQMLFNALNCGSHPLPTNRGQTTCPSR